MSSPVKAIGEKVLPPETVKRLLRLLWGVALLVVIVGSLLPATSFAMRALDRLHVSDKLEHGLAYAVLALLPALHERRRIVLVSALGAVGLGVALEYAQLYSGWRDFEVADMIADAIGICIGEVAGWALRCSAWMQALVGPPEAR